MLLILRVFNLIITYFYFFRESFIAELIISFVPYIIAFCLLAIILGIYLIIHQIRRIEKPLSAKKSRPEGRETGLDFIRRRGDRRRLGRASSRRQSEFPPHRRPSGARTSSPGPRPG